MGLNILTYAAAKKYVDQTVIGGGALKGKNCIITDISPIEGGNRVTFQWTLDDGTVQTDTLDIYDGEKGDKGDKGDRGAIGPQGAQGIQGVQGETGLTGAQGPQGIQGIPGEQGIQGIQGPKGDDGYPFLIYKQYDDISEFDEGDFPEVGLMFMVMVEDEDPETHQSIGYPIYRYTGEGNPPYSLVVHLASQGIKGEKGDKGDTGAQGPKGDTGEQGAKGDKGEKGDTGAQGIQGEQGVGLPDGGSTGQVLVKYSNTDYDFDWKDTTDTVRPNSHALVESGSVYSAINNALSSIYTPRGELTCAELTSSLLVEANVGNVYEMSDAGTTTALFLQGEGETINIGDNVGVIKAGANTYLFNHMANAFDLTDYQKKDLTTPITIGGVSRTTVEEALGALQSAKIDAVDTFTRQESTVTVDASTITFKSGLIIRTVNCNGVISAIDIFAGMPENSETYLYVSNLLNRPSTRNGILHAVKYNAKYGYVDYHSNSGEDYRMYNDDGWGNWQGIANRVSGATAGDIAALDANGNLVDSGVVASYVVRRVTPSTSVDCNDLIDRFTEYRVGDGDANRPTTDTNAYIIRTFRTGVSSTTYSQIAYQIGGTYIYRRYFNGTTWSPWRKLVSEVDMIYSTSERYTGKIWIDDKPIYRKVLHYAGVATKGVSTLIGSITGFADIITIEGTFRNNADDNCFPIGYTYSNFGTTVVQNMPFTLGNNGNLYASPYGFDISNINVIIEYTKTT